MAPSFSSPYFHHYHFWIGGPRHSNRCNCWWYLCKLVGAHSYWLGYSLCKFSQYVGSIFMSINFIIFVNSLSAKTHTELLFMHDVFTMVIILYLSPLYHIIPFTSFIDMFRLSPLPSYDDNCLLSLTISISFIYLYWFWLVLLQYEMTSLHVISQLVSHTPFWLLKVW